MPISICSFDQEKIVQRLKDLGRWNEVKKQSLPGLTLCWMSDRELFIWSKIKDGEGYAHFQSENIEELFYVVNLATGHRPTLVGKPPCH